MRGRISTSVFGKLFRWSVCPEQKVLQQRSRVVAVTWPSVNVHNACLIAASLTYFFWAWPEASRPVNKFQQLKFMVVCKNIIISSIVE